MSSQLGSAHSRQSDEATYKGAARLRSIVAPALGRVKPHEQQRGHPTWMLGELLSNAPDEAEIWDVMGHALNAGRAVGLPPATATVPGKSLVASMYEIYCEQKEQQSKNKGEEVVAGGKDTSVAVLQSSEELEEKKKAQIEQWTDMSGMSELLSNAIAMMFDRARTLGGSK